MFLTSAYMSRGKLKQTNKVGYWHKKLNADDTNVFKFKESTMHTYVYVVEAATPAIRNAISITSVLGVARPDFLPWPDNRKFEPQEYSNDVDGKWIGRLVRDFRDVAIVV